jgi:hypothetical protein
MDKKKILFIIGLVLIVILGIIAINISKKNKEPEPVDTLNENILKDTTVDGLHITNQAVITRDGISTYTANITNETSETKYIDEFYITFTVDGKKISALAIKDTNITSNQTLPISLMYDEDISKATKVEYK